MYAGFLIKASVGCEANNPRFIAGQLRTPRYWAWVAATSMRSGQPGINGKEYSSFLVPTAPKKEQDAIAETLSIFDSHIVNLAELIEKKKAVRDGALEELISGRTRLAGFHDSWRDSRIGQILKILHGINQRGVESPNGRYPIIGTGGVIGKATDFLCDWEACSSMWGKRRSNVQRTARNSGRS